MRGTDVGVVCTLSTTDPRILAPRQPRTGRDHKGHREKRGRLTLERCQGRVMARMLGGRLQGGAGRTRVLGATQAATPVKGREEEDPWDDLRQRPVTGEWVRAHVLVCIGEGDDS